MDLVQLFEDDFPSHKFYVWSPLAYGRPAQLSTSPIHKWAWDALPFYKVSFLYITIESDPNHPKLGDWMLELTVDTDDVVFTDYSNEPDASRFPDANSTNSTLRVVAWQCTEDMNFNWYHSIWSKGEWPENNDELFQQPEYPVQSISITVPLDDLPGREEVLALIARFKATLNSKLNIAST